MPSYRVKRKAGRALSKKQEEQVKTKIKRMITIRQEKKIHTYALAGQMPSLGSLNHLSAIPQGDTDLTRDGDKIRIKSIHFSWGVTGYDATNRIRLTLFQWHGDNVANPPSASDIYQVVTATGQFGVFRKDTESLYSILYDRYLCTDTYNNVVVGRVNIYKGFRKNMSYLGGTNNGTGQIYSIITSDSGVAPHPALDSQVCIRFTDS